jgi:hypothetical protein
MSTSVSLQGRELIAAWFGIDRGKAAFVVALADFDASGVWKEDMLDALFAAVDAYGEFLRHSGESKHWISPDSPDRESDPQDRPRPRAAQRLDWLFDLLHEVKLGDERKLDPYSASVGVTIQYEDLMQKTGNGLSDQGSTLSAEAVRRLCCDAGIVRIVVKGHSDILDLGREQRLFSRAQRRAIRFRHGHRCAVRGCGRRITQIHHILWWDDKGETCIDNGIPLCLFHHHLVHEGGWSIVWDATTGITRLEGPRGQILETTANFVRAA